MRETNENTNGTPLVTAARAGGRSELLATFGLLVIALIVVALAVTSLLLIDGLRREARTQAADNAPAIMNLAARMVRGGLSEPPERLQRLADDLLRVPNVRFCRIALLNAGNAGTEGAPIAAGSVHDLGETERAPLKMEITSEDGARRALLEVGFGVAPAAQTAALLGTICGSTAAAALALFGVIYHAARRRMRPIADIRNNLLAYHAGLEKELELLALPVNLAPAGRAGKLLAGGDGENETVQAWNALIASVRELRQELDGYRCRQAIAQSMPLLHSQAAQAILNALPIGVMRFDEADHLLYANASALRLLGLKEGIAESQPFTAQVADAKLAEAILALRSNTGRMGTDHRLEHGNGHTVVRLTRIVAGPERADELIVMTQDVSQLKEAERARDEFLAHITHELRTPLTNIRAYTETLNEDFFDDAQTRRECYNVIMSETRRLSSLIEDVLSVSQMEAGGPRLERVRTRVDQSLRQVAQEIQAAVDAKSIKLTLSIPSKLPAVLGDPFRLHQVWTNLVGNAVKYTPAGGQVGIDAQGDEKLLRIRVTDTGIGIAPEHHQKIFEKFFRVQDAAVEAQPGTGLGLPIAREIVRLHGGEIRVESEPGRGAAFIVELPAAREPEGEGAMEAGHGAHHRR